MATPTKRPTSARPSKKEGKGVTHGIACIQATEVIKCLAGIGELLENRLLAYDGLSLKFTEFKVQRNPECEHCAHL